MFDLEKIVLALERLLTIVNSWRKMLTLTCLVLLAVVGLLLARLSESQNLLAEVGAPKIERVSGWCYQQRVRGDRRIVAIQFPIPDYLVKLGVTQNLVAFVFKDQIDQQRFDQLCSGLIDEVFDPQSKIKLLRSNPEWQEKLRNFYINLDNPGVNQPIKKSDVEVKK